MTKSVDGQTGKLVGDLPVSRAKYWGTFFATTDKTVTPIDRIAERHPELDYQEINVDDESSEPLVDHFGIMTLPTVVITDNSGTDRKITGVQQEAALEEFILASADYIREHGNETEG